MLMMCAVFFHDPRDLAGLLIGGFVIAAVMGICKILVLGRKAGNKIRFALPVCLAQLAAVAAYFR